MLEASQYEDNAFVTLTYSHENLPEGGTLVPAHYQRWLKRLRKRLQPKTIRVFIVGEYGEGTERPHYHAILFGFPHCEHAPGLCTKRKCAVCSLISDTWGYGFVQVGTLTHASAQYCAGYITKKLTNKDDPRLKGRHPEFAQMSRRPGLGSGFMYDLASTILEHRTIEKTGDVPTALRHGTKLMPLGRYLTRRLRVLCGLAPDTPGVTIAKAQAEVHDLSQAAKAATENTKVGGLYKTVFRNAIADRNKGRILQIEARNRIFKQGKTL